MESKCNFFQNVSEEDFEPFDTSDSSDDEMLQISLKLRAVKQRGLPNCVYSTERANYIGLSQNNSPNITLRKKESPSKKETPNSQFNNIAKLVS